MPLAILPRAVPQDVFRWMALPADAGEFARVCFGWTAAGVGLPAALYIYHLFFTDADSSTSWKALAADSSKYYREVRIGHPLRNLTLPPMRASAAAVDLSSRSDAGHAALTSAHRTYRGEFRRLSDDLVCN